MIGATVACYSHPIAVSPQLRDAVAASLVLETAAFEVLLDEAYTLGARAGAASVAAAAKTERKMTAAASLLSHRRGGSADEEEDDDDDENGYSSERSSERGGSVRSKRQSASVDTKKAINAAIAPKAGVPAALGGRGAALAAGRGVPGALAGKAGIPARGAPGKGTGDQRGGVPHPVTLHAEGRTLRPHQKGGVARGCVFTRRFGSEQHALHAAAERKVLRVARSLPLPPQRDSIGYRTPLAAGCRCRCRRRRRRHRYRRWQYREEWHRLGQPDALARSAAAIESARGGGAYASRAPWQQLPSSPPPRRRRADGQQRRKARLCPSSEVPDVSAARAAAALYTQPRAAPLSPMFKSAKEARN
mmetsp:Transcript_4182/g.10834  ORF Transcript_4182/g.10834 Transcript_4182/m.10834 type:complete len:361 (+) Transcript_4182:1277-2359(+)